MKDNSRLQKLVQAFQAEEPPADIFERAKWLHQTLKTVSYATPMGLNNSIYVRPHLVRKLTFAHLQRLGPAGSKALVNTSWDNFLELDLPDEMNAIQSLPAELKHVPTLIATFQCHPMLFTCFTCLAKPALKRQPDLMEKLDYAQARESLREYVDLYGFNPSIERLFFWKQSLRKKKSAKHISSGSETE